MALALVAQATFDHVAANNDTLTYTSSGSGSGALMVVLASRIGGLATGAMTSVTDSTGTNTWTRATRGAVSGVQHTRIELWYTYAYASVTSISLNSSTSQYYATNLTEWSGIDTSADPVDVVSPDNSAGAAGTTQTTPTINTTNATDLIIAAIHYAQTTGTDNDGTFTDLTNFDSTTAGSGRAAYKFVSATGGYTDNWTLGVSQAAGLITASFKGTAVATDPVAHDFILSQRAIAQSRRYR